MDPALLDAYLRTTYWIEAPRGWLRLRIGARDPALERLLAERGARSWAVITSDNPRSALLPPETNAQRRRILEAELPRGWLRSWAVGDAGDWPPEIGCFVLGIGRAEAIAIGRRHGQNAIVFGLAGLAPELVRCD